MPPICAKFLQKSANQEGKILLALSDIRSDCVKSLHTAAKLYHIPYSTLCVRAVGRISCNDTHPNSHKLTQLEEDSLTEWILSMNSCGAAPRPSTVQEMANILLAACGTTPPLTVGVNWVSTFVK